MSSSTTASGGMGGTTALQIVFVTLKLLDKIDWSWWWVMAPTWMSATLAIIVIGVYLWVIR